MKQYHVYIDEGGMFGACSVLISKRKLYVKKRENHISNHYFGKLPKKSILRHLQLFNVRHLECPIHFHKESVKTYSLEEIQESGGIG